MKKTETFQAAKTLEAMSWAESANLISIDYAKREVQRATDNYFRGIGR